MLNHQLGDGRYARVLRRSVWIALIQPLLAVLGLMSLIALFA